MHNSFSTRLAVLNHPRNRSTHSSLGKCSVQSIMYWNHILHFDVTYGQKFFRLLFSFGIYVTYGQQQQ